MAYSLGSQYRTSSGGLLHRTSAGDRDLITGVPVDSGVGYAGATQAPTSYTSMEQGPSRTQALLNSLLNQANNTGRGYIDEAAMGAKSAADTAYGAMIRNMSRMGVNPQSPRFAAQMGKWASGRSAMEAAARNEAARAGQREGFGRQMSLWNALSGLEEGDKSRNFQAGQANAARAFEFNQAQQQREWNVADRGLMAEADKAEQEAFLNALGMNQDKKGKAPSISPYSRAAGKANVTSGVKTPSPKNQTPSTLSLQIPPPVQSKPLEIKGYLAGKT